jgi:hypothetical protein
MGSPCSKLVILLIGCQTTFNNIESKSKKGKKLVQRNNQTENSQIKWIFFFNWEATKYKDRANKNVIKNWKMVTSIFRVLFKKLRRYIYF